VRFKGFEALGLQTLVLYRAHPREVLVTVTYATLGYSFTAPRGCMLAYEARTLSG
jgi:hypothetical protein